MLYLSLLFVLAGISLLSAAGLMITYLSITTGEKNLLLVPRKWPPEFKKWARYGGFGLASILVGMLLAVAAT
ncbi:MAG: hypothetical protein K6T66_15020 [Peptococcaceae bacterium]|nr:hypothetical protein [Peptococcaceae bacterium]